MITTHIPLTTFNLGTFRIVRRKTFCCYSLLLSSQPNIAYVINIANCFANRQTIFGSRFTNELVNISITKHSILYVYAVKLNRTIFNKSVDQTSSKGIRRGALEAFHLNRLMYPYILEFRTHHERWP